MNNGTMKVVNIKIPHFILAHVTIILGEIFEVVFSLYLFLRQNYLLKRKLVIYNKNNIIFTILFYLDY